MATPVIDSLRRERVVVLIERQAARARACDDWMLSRSDPSAPIAGHQLWHAVCALPHA